MTVPNEAGESSGQLPLRQVPRIHIIGRKNAGKTTLVCDLVQELGRQGFRVATIKHTHHHHELDTPGKDSHKHRESGAAGVGILSPQMMAAFVPGSRKDDGVCHYDRFNIMFNDCDLIIVEGDQSAVARKIEVWRTAAAEQPYALSDNSISAVITDHSVAVSCDVWSRRDIAAIARNLVKLIQGGASVQTP